MSFSHFLIYLSYGIPSVILTILVIICILKNRNFMASSFYRVYLFVLITYLITYLNSYIIIKCRELSILTRIYLHIEISFPPYRLFYVWQFASFYVGQSAFMMLHLNRFTSLWIPITHRRIWEPRYIWFTGLVLVIVGIGLCYSDFWLSPLYVEDGGFAVDNGELYIGVRLSVMLMGYFGHFFPFAALFLDILIFVKLIYMRVNRKGSPTSLIVEVNLLFICFSTLFVQIAMMLYMDYNLVLFTEPEIMLLMRNFALDLFTLSEAYIGVALNRNLRRQLLLMVFGKRNLSFDPPSAFQKTGKNQTQISRVVSNKT